MNRYLQEKWPWIEGSHAMRMQLLDTLSDADLAYTPGGRAQPLGALCREMGDTEYAYIESLKTFKQDWSYHNTQPGLERSVAQLKAWFGELDEQLKAIVSAFTDDDLQRTVDRGGYPTPVDTQLDVYLQALLIFFGKATVYLRTMDRSLPQGFEESIG